MHIIKRRWRNEYAVISVAKWTNGSTLIINNAIELPSPQIPLQFETPQKLDHGSSAGFIGMTLIREHARPTNLPMAY